MIIQWEKVKIFIRPGATDMRKQTNGLSMIVDEGLRADPFSGNLYLFTNRARKLLKVLYWDKTGFCLWQKRLEKDRFPWPSGEEEAREITKEQLLMLLEGINFWNAHKTITFSEIKYTRKTVVFPARQKKKMVFI